MSGKLSEVEGRIGTVRQLDAVISAMRGIAAARSREARSRLDGVRAYASAVGTAIGTALGLTPDRGAAASGRDQREGRLLIVLCGQQGFAGSFNDRVLDNVAGHLDSSLVEILLVGDRGAMVAAERGLAVSRVAPMVEHIEDVPALANRITDALYQRLESKRAMRVTMACRSRSFWHDRHRRAGAPAVRLHPLSRDALEDPADRHAPARAVARSTRRRVRLCRAVRGGDVVLRR